jgi:hypothetical protein
VPARFAANGEWHNANSSAAAGTPNRIVEAKDL